jgi:hypothetical protein
MVTREEVVAAYELILQRPPEDEAAIEYYLTFSDLRTLGKYLVSSAEFSELHARPAGRVESPFWFYTTMFDVEGTIQRQAVQSAPDGNFVTNFLGVKIDPKFFPTILTDRAGEVEDVPIPANWHADMAEWAYAIRSAERASNPFTMIELGCGWACWLNNIGTVAKRLGKDVHLIGVEGDEGHIQFARESLATNGFRPEEYSLVRGIAAATTGIALFPRQEFAGGNWGLSPVIDASEEQRAAAASSGQYEELPMVALADVAERHPCIDLLHVDIQGGEVALIEGCLDFLRQKCASILIGTHGRDIEGRLFEILFADGWKLDIERPAIIRLVEGQPIVIVDGVQGWRNPRITPNP